VNHNDDFTLPIGQCAQGNGQLFGGNGVATIGRNKPTHSLLNLPACQFSLPPLIASLPINQPVPRYANQPAQWSAGNNGLGGQFDERLLNGIFRQFLTATPQSAGARSSDQQQTRLIFTPNAAPFGRVHASSSTLSKTVDSVTRTTPIAGFPGQ